MVPIHDSKELIVHARKKEGELRAMGLPFIDDDFVVVIHTEADFQKELAIIESHGVGAVGTVPMHVGDKDLQQLTENEPEQVQTLDRKLSKVVPDPKDLRERFLRHAVDGGNIREHLRRNHPQTNEQVAGQVANEARDVLAERDLGELHKGSITEVRKRMENRLRERVTALGDDQANRLAYATVATWLMECPLDFPAEQS